MIASAASATPLALDACTPTPALPNAIAEVLQPGETVRWVGRPRQGFFVRPVERVIIPAILMAAWGLAYAIADTGNDSPSVWIAFAYLSPWWGWLTLGRQLLDVRQRRYTFYAITSTRVLAVGRRRSSAARTALPLRDILPTVWRSRDGRGTITLSHELPWRPAGRWPRRYAQPMLEMIDDVQAVNALLLQAKAQAVATRLARRGEHP